MGRGGYRAGAGRKRGTKDSTPRRTKNIDAPAASDDKINDALSFDKIAKARFCQEFLVRVGKGEQLPLIEKKLFDKYGFRFSFGVDAGEPEDPSNEVMTPLEYMLKELNKPRTSQERKDRLAIALAPFLHPRKGDGVGKKNEKEERAKDAGQGKFAAGKPPIHAVK
jgi:hypothetical protein